MREALPEVVAVWEAIHSGARRWEKGKPRTLQAFLFYDGPLIRCQRRCIGGRDAEEDEVAAVDEG
jgi:hypothetical protein